MIIGGQHGFLSCWVFFAPFWSEFYTLHLSSTLHVAVVHLHNAFLQYSISAPFINVAFILPLYSNKTLFFYGIK